jgi:choline dehydrogenase-like flavoprotein
MTGRLPVLENSPIANEDGTSSMHTYAPWTIERQKEASKMGAPRGYYMAWSGGRGMPDMGTAGEVSSLVGNAWGKKYKEEARRYYGTFVDIHARGEMIPNEKSFIELDPVKKDQYGIPVLRFHFQWSDHEIKQVGHMQKSFAELIEASGGVLTNPVPTDPSKVMTAGGSVNHEMGVARMSADAKDGVTNSFGQLWDCPNVLVVDGAVFCSNPYKNPTITIMALAWRACEELIKRSKK